MAGWIKLHRDLLDKPIWKNSTPEQKSILITLLLMADYEGNEWEFNGEKYKTAPGEKITSLNTISEKSGKGISFQNVRSALKRFEKLDFLTDESTRQGRLIKIVNWEAYQSFEDEGNKPINKEVTNGQQTDNKRVTPKEESKEREEVKEVCLNNIPEEILKLKSRYPNPNLIDRVFDVLKTTRKTSQISESILLSQLKKWDRYPVQQVEAGIAIYLDKDLAGEGKNENYLYGIIRNNKPGQEPRKGGMQSDFRNQQYNGTDLSGLSWVKNSKKDMQNTR